MAKKVASFRLDVELLEWLGSYAKSRKTTQAVLVEAAVRDFKALAEGGVPDLPVAARVDRAESAAAGQVKRARDLVPSESHESVMKARQARLNKKMGWSS